MAAGWPCRGQGWYVAARACRLPSARPCVHLYSVKGQASLYRCIWSSARLRLFCLLAHNCSVYPKPSSLPTAHQGPQQSWWGWTWRAETAQAKAWWMHAYKLGAPLGPQWTGSKVVWRGSPLPVTENAYSCAPKWPFNERVLGWCRLCWEWHFRSGGFRDFLNQVERPHKEVAKGPERINFKSGNSIRFSFWSSTCNDAQLLWAVITSSPKLRSKNTLWFIFLHIAGMCVTLGALENFPAFWER